MTSDPHFRISHSAHVPPRRAREPGAPVPCSSGSPKAAVRGSAMAEVSSEVGAFLPNGLVGGRIQAFEMAGLRSLLSGRLSSKACSQPREAPCRA